MIFITYPAMLIALVPVIFLETLIFESYLHAGWRGSGWRVAIANAASTIVGFPLTWLALLLIGLVTTGGGSAYGLATWWTRILAVTLQAAWLVPYEPDLAWMIPSAAAVGLIPAFFVSVGIEGLVLRRLFHITPEKVWQATWKANAVSYLILIVLIPVWLLRRA